MKILVPKRWMSVDEIATEEVVHTLFFLAGPVRGGGDWQKAMCLALQKEQWVQSCVIVCPCRWDGQHSLAKYFVDGPERVFARQLDWERHYLEIAGTHKNPGCIVFWLGRESKLAPHPGPEPYATDTRGELGEWRARMKTDNARVVIGAESAFPGLSQIQRNFSLALGYDFPIHKTVQETATAAAKRAVGL